MNGGDNGFLMLNHVRVPRENMLMGNTNEGVSADSMNEFNCWLYGLLNLHDG